MRILAAIFTFLLCFSPNSFALGKLGHRLVCQLAYEQLTPQVQQDIDTLLATLPKQEKSIIKQYNYRANAKNVTFGESCTWADAIKKKDKYEKFKTWHFINVDRSASRIPHNTCNNNCVTHAITFHSKQVKQASAKRQQLEALMFLGHWVGDIHQPLHVSFKSDFGGNKTRIQSNFAKCNNLHWYWDQCLLLSLDVSKLKSSKQHRAYESNLLTELRNLLVAESVNQWKDSTVIDWANESLELVRQATFNYCEVSQAVCNEITNQPIVINEKYHAHYQQILKQRIMQASVRLAHILQTSLSRPVQ
ncbi:S1/P1 nuclease [Thalassotalea fusca]